MPIRNLHSYGLNAQRAYPLDPTASTLTDRGEFLPSSIIVDLNLQFPDVVGAYAFVGAVAVVSGLVTVTIQSSTSATVATGLTPLAAVSVLNPVPGRQYALDPQVEGCGGWIVFGPGAIEKAFSGRFSTPAQSLLAARAARAAQTLPISGIGTMHTAAPLTGLVRLRGTSPIEVVKETRLIGETERDVAVVRLTQPVEQDENVFEQFSGPCGQRPESGTCGTPEPIQLLSAINPDCAGNVTVEFRGCGQLAQLYQTNPLISVPNGAVIECELGLEDVCIREERLPDEDGNLPNDYDDACGPYPDPDPDEPCENTYVPDDDLDDPDPGDEEDQTLAYLDNFDDYLATGFQHRSGGWVFAEDDSPSEMLQPNPLPTTITGPTDPTADTTPTIDWDAVSGGKTYELWVNNLSTGGTQVIYETGIVGSQYTVPTPMDPGDYVAYVRVHGRLNSRSIWSAGYPFTVSGVPVTVPDPDDPTVPSNSAIPPIDSSMASEHAYSVSGRNVTVWYGFDNTSIKRRFTTDVKLMPGPPGAKHNAGVVLDYKTGVSTGAQERYYVAEIDYDLLKLRIVAWNGTNFVVLTDMEVPELALNRWYRLKVSTGAQFFSGVNVTVNLTNITGPAVNKTLGPFRVDDYDGVGLLGLATNRAHSRFSFIYIEQLP